MFAQRVREREAYRRDRMESVVNQSIMGQGVERSRERMRTRTLSCMEIKQTMAADSPCQALFHASVMGLLTRQRGKTQKTTYIFITR